MTGRTQISDVVSSRDPTTLRDDEWHCEGELHQEIADERSKRHGAPELHSKLLPAPESWR